VQLKRFHSLVPVTAVVAALALAATGTGTARAAALDLGAACTYSGAALELSGSGFSPNGVVTLTGAASGTATTDATGSFSRPFRAPASPSLTGRTATIQASDGNPANTAKVKVKVVKDQLATNAPLSGKPGSVVTWRFAGFDPGRPIYGHFRLGNHTQRNFRFGLASGPCGTLTVRAQRVPTASKPGSWMLQLDQQKAYARSTEPRRTIPFTIQRRLV
jgi:hypothetical protein